MANGDDQTSVTMPGQPDLNVLMMAGVEVNQDDSSIYTMLYAASKYNDGQYNTVLEKL